jgi:hypothetical protein
MSPLRREVERLLEVGSRCGAPKTAGTCRDILKRRTALGTFVQAVVPVVCVVPFVVRSRDLAVNVVVTAVVGAGPYTLTLDVQ